MSDKIIVLVSDRGDSKHGEISMVEDPHKAEKLVETLLEAGFEQERIHVFTGTESDFQVSQRPVVALVGDDEGEEPRAGSAEEEATAVAAEPAPEQTAKAEEPDGDGGQKEESETEEEPAAVEAGAPVKFSSLFRSA